MDKEGKVVSFTTGGWGTIRCENGETFNFHATRLWSIGGLTAPGDRLYFSVLHDTTIAYDLKRSHLNNVYVIVHAGVCGTRSGFRIYVRPEDRIAVRREERDVVRRNGHVALVKAGTKVLQHVWEKGMEISPFIGRVTGTSIHPRRFEPIIATDEDFDALKEGMDWVLSGASGTQPSFWPD